MGLRLGQTAPGNFRIGEDDGRNGVGFERDFVSGNGLDRGAAFVHRFVRQHGFANNVTDSVDGGVASLQLLVHLDKTFGADFDSGFLETGNFRVGLAANRDQDAIKNLFLRGAVLGFQSSANAAAFVFDGRDGGVEEDSIKHFFQAFV